MPRCDAGKGSAESFLPVSRVKAVLFHLHLQFLFLRGIPHIVAADEHTGMLVLIAAAQRTQVHVLIQLLWDGSFVGKIISAQRGVAVDALEDRVIVQLFR